MSIKETEVREWLQHFKLGNLGNDNGSSRRGKDAEMDSCQRQIWSSSKNLRWRGPKRDRNNMSDVGPKDITFNFIKPEPIILFYRVNKVKKEKTSVEGRRKEWKGGLGTQHDLQCLNHRSLSF